ncbi:hypothetical protein G7046_g8666 [Stylonectria norvegica]|nr:hypothetical protein G7046_g8666 [Stylonectria norvegica]
MSGPGVGFEYPAQEVSWLARDVLLFANTIGCTSEELHFLYELNPKFDVFPTYPVVLLFKGNTQDVIDFYAAQKAVKIPGVPDFDPSRVVDGQRKMGFFKALPPTSEGHKFEFRTRVLGVYDKGKPGSVVETESDLVDASSGEVYSRITTSSFYVAQGGWGGPKGPATVNFPPPKGKKPDFVLEHQSTKQSSLLYRLNGDYNPLHATPEPGAKMGFGGTIMHGLYSWNTSCHELLKALGGSDPANLKEFQARFASPVLPGDKVVTSVWRTGEMKGEWEEIRFVAQVEGGKVCLSNGRALVRVVDAGKSKFTGQRVSYDGALCTVRFVGEVAGTTGAWLGVEWDDPARGKHSGCHKGVQYFSCISKSPTAASFVRPSRPSDVPQSFIAALNDKYASDFHQRNGRGATAEIVISGKRAQEIGFDKIRRKQAQAAELKIVILDDMQVASALADGETEGAIEKTCPKIIQLDLSRNMFDRLRPVVDICRELPALQSLSINGNRFQHVLDEEALQGSEQAFRGVKELSLEETMLNWGELCHIATKCPVLSAFDAGSNQLNSLPVVDYLGLTSTLTSINLEINDFTTLADISSLTALASLRNIHLKGNNIITLAPEGVEAPLFSSSVQYLDLSYNNIQSWSFVDQLPKHFPGLIGLRIGHNPFYDATGLDTKVTSSEESHMFTVARIKSLKTLNFSQVTAADRTNSETFYLSRIAKQVAAAPEGAEASVIELHPRYAELCELHGEPSIIRRQEVNPAFLESRLVTVGFHLDDGETKTAKIPKSFDIYAVKGIAGRIFSTAPLKLALIWETGEWDPVAGFDEQEGDSSDEEDAEEERERQGLDVSAAEDIASRPGRWVKREVELKDGPRQLGYCVDGLDVKIRVVAR